MNQFIKTRFQIIFFLALLFWVTISSAQIIQLHPGNDIQTTLDGINASDMKEDLIIELAGGRYELTRTLKFNNKQSGTNGYRVIVRSAANELAQISGGTKITGWSPFDNNIVKAIVPSDFNFRQLYINGAKAERSEHIYNGTTFIHAVCETYNLNGTEYVAFKVSNNEAIAKGIPTNTSPWENLQNVEVRFHSTYRKYKVRLMDVQQKNGFFYYIFPKQVSETLKNNTMLLQNTQSYDISFENAFKFIDDKGEWYLDESNHIVYYKLKDGETVSNIEAIAPRLDRLIEVDGSDNLTFFGLTFEHSTWLYPSQAGNVLTDESFYKEDSWTNEKQVPAAIYVRNADNLIFERNIIRYTGGSGINVDDEYPVKNLEIKGNVFYKTASTAINLCQRRFNPPTTDAKLGVFQPFISNNYFYETAFEYGNNVFAAHYAYQLDFSHNEIFRCTNMALGLGYGSSVGNLYRFNVKNNKFESCGMEATDLGVIHIKFQSGGSRLVENWFNNSKKVVTGRGLGKYYNSVNDPFFGNIYLDNFAKDITSIGNVHSNLSLNGYSDRMDTNPQEQGKHIYYGVGTTGTSIPNYLINDYSISNPSVEANAGLTQNYIDIKGFATDSPGSIAGNKLPSKMEFVSVMIDDRDSDNPNLKVKYTGSDGQGQGSWTKESPQGTNLKEGAYLDTYTSTTASGDQVTITFHGTAIDVLAPKNGSQSNMEVYLDGELVSTINLNSTVESWQQVVYRVQNLAKREHILVLKKTNGVGSKLSIDGFEIKLSGTALEIVQLYPQQGNLHVHQDDGLQLSFNRNVKPISGKYIKIYTSDGVLFDSIESTSGQVKINGVAVVITPSKLLEKNKYYYVLIDGGAFNNQEGDPYVGLSDVKSWSFATLSENIALNKPSTASGIFNDNYAAINGNDGNTDNVWSSGSVPSGSNAWWQVDLINQFKINNIELVSRQTINQEFARKEFRILGSNSADFTSFTELASQGSNPFEDKATWQASINNNSGFRYLRVEKSLNNVPMNFAEFRAFGDLTVVTGIELDRKQLTFKTYPNPANNILYIESDTKIDLIKIFDINGRIMKQKSCNRKVETIMLDNISAGIYILKVYNSQGIGSNKIIIN